jgi:hypothetical protein
MTSVSLSAGYPPHHTIGAALQLNPALASVTPLLHAATPEWYVFSALLLSPLPCDVFTGQLITIHSNGRRLCSLISFVKRGNNGNGGETRVGITLKVLVHRAFIPSGTGVAIALANKKPSGQHGPSISKALQWGCNVPYFHRPLTPPPIPTTVLLLPSVERDSPTTTADMPATVDSLVGGLKRRLTTSANIYWTLIGQRVVEMKKKVSVATNASHADCFRRFSELVSLHKRGLSTFLHLCLFTCSFAALLVFSISLGLRIVGR